MKNKNSVESIGAATGQTPPAPPSENLGKVEISPEAIATIAARSLENCYGVVGLAARRLRGGQVVTLKPEQTREGIQVTMAGGKISIDLYIILEHNLRISEVAHNVMETVAYQVEKSLGMPVDQVNINVQGLRLANGTTRVGKGPGK